MKFFETMTMKRKLTLMLLVPILGLAWFAQGELRGTLELKLESDGLLELAELSVRASAMVHELQKERGMSAGFLGSNGTSFVSELPAQHHATDQKVAELNEFLETFAAESFGSEFKAGLDRGLRDLGELAGTRSRITGLNISSKEGIGYYTGMNGAFLELVGYLPKLSSVGELNNSASAYVGFLQSKERAGIERAVVTSVFAQNAFGPGIYERFQALVVTQNVYMQVFDSLASKEQREFYASTLQGRAIDETTRMRQVAIDKAATGNFGIDPTDWFQMQTDKINLLKTVEDRLSADLRVQATAIRDTAFSGSVIAIVVAAAALGLAIMLGIGLMRSVLRQLGADPARLAEVVEAIGSDDLHMDLDTDKPATGIYREMQTMQGNLRERIEADRQALAENTRIKQALDSVKSNVMVADADNTVIYMNDTLKEMFRNAEADIRKDLPQFNASDLMGQSMDVFHKNPAHQRSLIDNLTSTISSEIEVGGRTLRVMASPVLGADGERLGTVVEWADRTQEVAVEKEVQGMVENALAGDLTTRISLDDKDGFFATLSSGVNDLVGVAEKIINDTIRVLSAMAAGNLTETIEADYAGSFGKLKDDANATVAKLTEVVGNIQATSGSVKTGADEMSQGNTNLSQRTEEQASSLEETASSMEEMTSTVKQNADNAGEANQLAMAAREQAEKGGAVVSQAVEAMNEINASSRKISDIIGVIDEIAFQTNLLALNASVEAARAGDQGRGFAVVASEVRNLAGRSATAAKEIKELIEDSGVKVDDGSRLVNESGETLAEIVNGVKKVTDIVGEIAAASQEQSAGIDEVNKAIVQLDELTQQNAALVEQAAAASESMGEQADDLNQMMDFFTVDGNAAHARTAAAGSPPGGVERRSVDRPWTAPETAEATEEVAAPAPQKKAAAGGGDQEWEEF